MITLGITITCFGFAQAGKISQQSVFVSHRLGNIAVYHDNNGFSVKNSSESYPVQRCFMDKELRGITKNRLKKVLVSGGYLTINKMNDSNEYSVRLNIRVKGGGVVEASVGFMTGKFAAHLAAQGLITAVTAGVAVVCPIAAPAVCAALQLTFVPLAKATSNAIGIDCAIALATATGPV